MPRTPVGHDMPSKPKIVLQQCVGRLDAFDLVNQHDPARCERSRPTGYGSPRITQVCKQRVNEHHVCVPHGNNASGQIVQDEARI
jgi:hypothetical protein